MRRLFVAVNLPETAKEQLLAFKNTWQEIPGRWTTKENLHITLVFIGVASEKETQEIQRILTEAGRRNQPFAIRFSRIMYGPASPAGRPSHAAPRMIWATGEAPKEFLDLKKDLEKSLAASPKLHFKPEQRDSTLHLTLMRIDQWKFANIEPEERPLVKEGIDIFFPVNSIELMESKLTPRGAIYSVVQSVSL